MPRRRKNGDADVAELIIKLGGLFIVLVLLAVGPAKFAATMQGIAIVCVVSVLIIGLLTVAVIIIWKKWKHENDGGPLVESRPFAIPVIAKPERQPLSGEDFITRLREIDWYQFEKLIGLIYEQKGCRVIPRGGANPDGGIDLIVEQNGQKFAVQCKQWKTWNVGVRHIRELLGAMTHEKITRGIFITLNGYTGDAKQLAESNNIEILDETSLTAMIEGLNLHENPRVQDLVNDTKKYCPKCERLMVERTAEKGPNPGQKFWGCSGYPRCRFTMPF